MREYSPLKKWIVVGALALICATNTGAVWAEQTNVKEKDVTQNVSSYLQWNSPVTVKLDGKLLQEKAAMINTDILVPFRSVFEAVGAQIEWDAKNGAAYAVGNNLKVKLTVGSELAEVNGQSYKLDHEAVIIDNRLMIPERVLSAALNAGLHWDSSKRELSVELSNGSGGLTIRTDAFQPFGDIPVKYAHDGVEGGRNISLPVQWSGAPEGTRSFAVVMYDLHPIADNYIHWSVINLPAATQGLDEGAAGHLKEGKELNGYFGMEPPRYSGDHLYRIAVFALDTEQLEIPKQPIFFDQLEPELKKHTLAYAEADGFFRQ